MNLIGIYRKINILINRYDFYKTPIEKQEEFLYSLKSPEGLIECSYLQYRCQNKLKAPLQKLLSNIGACFLLVPVMVRLFNKISKREIVRDEVDVVYLYDFMYDSYLPKNLINDYKSIRCIQNLEGSFCEDDQEIIKVLFLKYLFEPYFLLKCLMKVAQFSEAFRIYNPNIVISSAEYSFTSSILTYYCREHRVKHINIMHGEKIFDICDAFASFDEFYIWEEHYESLFRQLRSQTVKYYIYNPEIIFPRQSNRYLLENNKIDYKFYLAEISKKEIKKLGYLVSQLKEKGYTVVLRYHPRFNVTNELIKVVSKDIIELPNEIDILESISEAKYIVSEYSTVLNQAYNMGKLIVLDDLINPKRFAELKKAEYIMLKKEHKLLSEILKGENIGWEKI